MNNFLTLLKSKRQLNLLIAAAFMILQLILVLSIVPNVSAQGNDDKVFVCKYVGKPGADERLQTGQNPISVSVNAIKDYKGVGSYFNDKQGRSFVLMVDDKDKNTPEPAASACPAPGGGNGGGNGGDDNGDVLGDSSRRQASASAAAGGVGAGLGGGAGSIVASAFGLVASLGALGYGATNLLRRKS